jgi:hypothetical protein
MAHPVARSFQEAWWVIEVDPAPETKVDKLAERLDVAEWSVDLVHRLGPLEGFVRIGNGLLDLLPQRCDDLGLPIVEARDVLVNSLGFDLCSSFGASEIALCRSGRCHSPMILISARFRRPPSNSP